ncbi:DJ-1/PfpI family protein [Arthrobacter cryoconiti]|uniref:DJ-1/PfpI family protein n=1 Tax=Arthrobacter cryoconiti TaxID=748907 RepID=UPI001E480F8F|nr:DJ-1/PfpI family protein [Arthrobacter cryoconiti]
MNQRQRVSIVLFDGFELLDVFGPVELLGMAPDLFELDFLGPSRDLVSSSQGMKVAVTETYETASEPDIVLVPGGMGTRKLVEQPEFLEWLHGFSRSASLVTSVCTGAAVLAAAGLLDGHRATSNKLAFRWVTTQGPHVEWVPEARWVVDRNRWTSSGVAAGMDMTAALIRYIHGDEVAQNITSMIELDVHHDSTWDPFAHLHGLVED